MKINYECFSLPPCSTPPVPTAGKPVSSRPPPTIHGSQVLNEPIKDVNVLDPSFYMKILVFSASYPSYVRLQMYRQLL